MTPEQQASSIRHQKEEHITPEEIGKMATTAGVKTVVLTHLRPPPIQKTNTNVSVSGEETLFRPGACCQRPNAVLTG